MPDEGEAILGDFRVSAKLSMGSEFLRLFFTDKRIIVAHIGKRGTGSAATVSFFGRLSAGIEDLLKGGRESVSKRKLRTSTPAQILSEDKDNFSVNYSDIVEVKVDQALARPKIVMLTKDDKYQFTVTGGSGVMMDLLQKTLDGRVRVV